MQINQPYVDLSSAQTVGGAKTFTAALTAGSTLGVTGTLTAAGTLAVNGALAQGINSATSVTPTVRSTDVTVTAAPSNSCTAETASITLTLPVAANSINCRITFTKIDPSANTVTIVPQAGGTIGGAASYVLTAQYQSVTLQNIHNSVNGAWVVIGKT